MIQWQKFVAQNLAERTKAQEEVQKGLRPERRDFFRTTPEALGLD